MLYLLPPWCCARPRLPNSLPLQARFVAFAINATGGFDNPSDASALVTVGALQLVLRCAWV